MREFKSILKQGGWTTIITFIVKVVVSYAIGYALNAIFGKKNDPRIISPNFQDNETMVRSAVEAHKIIYGQALVSGPLTFAATNGASNESLHIVLPLAGHEVEEIGTVYFDDIDSSAAGYNKIEVWDIVPSILVVDNFLGFVMINGEIFVGGGHGNSRIKLGRSMVQSLYDNITTSPGYASRNYTVSIPSIHNLRITGKTIGDEVVTSLVKVNGTYIIWDSVIGGYSAIPYFFNDGNTGANESNQLFLSLAVKSHIFDIYKHFGADSQLADSNLVAENVGWTNSHRLRGRAYIYCKLKYYADRWPTGIPVLKAEVKGRKVYDPRTGLTAWSDNPALCLRDYLVSSSGLNADTAEIDEASFIAAANICDEWVLSATPAQILESAINTAIDTFIIHTGPTTGGSLGHNLRTGDSVEIVGHTGSIPSLNGTHESITRIDDVTLSIFVSSPTGIIGGTGGAIQLRQRRYRCNGAITLGERPIDVVQKLLTCCDGTIVYTEGTYKMFVGAYTASVGNLNESHLRGGIQVIAKQPRKSLFNGVRGTFRDKSRYWQETDFPAYKNATYITQDGGEEILRDITLPFTTDTYAAQRLSKQMLERARQGVLVSFPAKLSAFKYAVNDVIQLSISHLGWTNKEFRILSWSLEEFGISIQMQEEASSSYAWNSGDETSIDTAPDTNLPNAFDVQLPTAVTAVEQLYQGLNTAGFRSRIKVGWVASADSNVVGYVVHWKAYADTVEADNNWHDGQSQVVTGTSFNLEDVPLGTFFITIKALNNLGFYSLETAAIQVVVLGKTAPPADVSGFSVGQNGDVVVFTWSMVADIDLKGYEVRYGPRVTMTWDSGVVVTQAERGTEVTTALIPPGDWKFCIKAQDTSDIYSTNATCRDLEITQSRTIVQTLIEEPDFLGTKSNFVLHWTGSLVPDSQGLAADSLLHFDGDNGSTTITDENAANTWAVAGNAQISTAQSKFGGAALLLDGTGDYVTGAAVALSAGTGFNRSIWFRLSALGTYQTVIGATEALKFDLRISPTNFIEFLAGDGATWTISGAGPTVIASGVWYRVRAAWDGSTYKVYLSVNGAAETEEISVTSAVAHATGNGTSIGAHGTVQLVNGHLDEYRNVVGTTVLGVETPPAVAYAYLAASSWDTFDQFVPNAYTTCLYTPLNDIDIGFVDDVRAWADISATMGPGETTGSPQPFTEIDYHSGAGFDGFEPWTIGLLNARYLRMRLGVTPALGKCYISRYRVNADVAEQTESGSGLVVGASGTAVVFGNQFHSAPSIQITVQGTALIPTYTGATGVGFTAHVYDTSGVEVGGTINWTAIGV